MQQEEIREEAVEEEEEEGLLENEKEVFLSEVHITETPQPEAGIGEDRFITRLKIVLPLSSSQPRRDEENTAASHREGGIAVDEEGDLIVVRRKVSTEEETQQQVITLVHSMASPLCSVGLQLWRGALLLSDYLLYEGHRLFQGCSAMDLGCGVGLTSIVMAMFASTLWATDYEEEILKNCERNIQLNSYLFNSSNACSSNPVHVKMLDWSKGIQTAEENGGCKDERFCWSSEEMKEVARVSVFLAADVIYEDSITDSFFHTLRQLMQLTESEEGGSQASTAYIAIEKRINFTLEDLAPTAKAYSHFRTYFIASDDEQRIDEQAKTEGRPHFKGTLISTDCVPQYFDYDRVKELELWNLTLL
ncbi:Methyltransferase-like protein 22 [Balamuthia mandrillaris]